MTFGPGGADACRRMIRVWLRGTQGALGRAPTENPER
jgi:hypothetical protein